MIKNNHNGQVYPENGEFNPTMTYYDHNSPFSPGMEKGQPMDLSFNQKLFRFKMFHPPKERIACLERNQRIWYY